MTLATSTSIDDELASIIQHITISDDDADKAPRIDVLTNESDKLDGITSTAHGGQPTATTPKTGESSPEVSEDEYTSLVNRVRTAAHQVALLLDQIYEIQELRHATSSTPAPTNTPSANRLDSLLSSLSDTATLLRPQITLIQAVTSSYTGPKANDLVAESEELLTEWKRAEEQHHMLREEMKEDGWLVRFRTTADQADAMIEPLSKSCMECMQYVERLSNATVHGSYTSSFDFPSIEGLGTLARSHDSMTKTYVPSIIKILKMMDRSISERPIKNGEALRRFGEMTHRWTTLQKELQQLDARVRIITSQYAQSDMGGSPGEVEILADTSPYGSPDSRGEYFGYGIPKSSSDSRPPANHRSSISSSLSTTSTRSDRDSQPRPSPSGKVQSSSLSPDTALRPLQLRRRSSVISNASASTERTRWKSADHASSDNMRTPTHKRYSTVPNPHVPRSISPTPSTASVTSTMSRRQSRIPVASPNRFSPGSVRNDITIPGLSVSTSLTRTMLAEPSTVGRGQNHLTRARMGLKTPEPARPRISATFSAFQSRPSISGTPTSSRSYSSGMTPKTAPSGSNVNRSALTRGPPSAFRVSSPTPSGTRPSSRLSLMSYSNFNPAALAPFEPSKYDLLDMEVSRILDEVDFDLFVARVDQAMKRGQRRRDDEEWKGEYVFGAGEKPTGVKLLNIAGAKPGAEKRVKCLVRSGGAWHDLATLLRARKSAARGE